MLFLDLGIEPYYQEQDMPDQTITCPFCSEEISLSDTLYKQIKESTRKEFEVEARKKESDLKARERTLEETISKRLAAERQKLSEAAEKKAAERFSLKMKAMEDENTEKSKRLDEAEKAELELRKQAHEVEEKGKKMDLEIARRVDADREKIRNDALSIFSDEHRLNDAAKDKKISDILRLNEELKRKAEQGSMQTQGEVLELDLEDMLLQSFPIDTIKPVPKGIKGADVLHEVNSNLGHHCGTIAWELKRTKAFSEEWISKLKDDAREVKAEVAVLVTEALPKDITGFAEREGVWVTSPALAPALAGLLRGALLDLAHVRSASEGKGEKMEMVYNYLSGPEFKHRIDAIVEAFSSMQVDLDKEKRAITKIWAKRQKQIDKITNSTVGLHGDLGGLIGATLPEIKALELESGEGGGEDSGEEAQEGAAEETLEGR